MSESQTREDFVRCAKSIYDQGLTHGSTGNLSIRLDDGWLLTPTDSTMGNLDPSDLSKIDWNGKLLSGKPSTKGADLHLAVYQQRTDCGAVVHLHATHSVALSLIEGLDPQNLIPPLTAYFVMRVGKLPMVPYFPPGDRMLIEAVRKFAGRHHAMLLAHHGPVVAGSTLESAINTIEELEATAQVFLLVYNHKYRTLNSDQVGELHRRFG